MKYATKTIQQYIRDLSKKKPIPGGGSVAALTAAMATALISMAANYTSNKEASQVLRKVKALQKRLLNLSDLDIDAYLKVTKARKKGWRDYQSALKVATKVPLEVCLYCNRGLSIIREFKKKSNKNLIKSPLKYILNLSLILHYFQI